MPTPLLLDTHVFIWALGDPARIRGVVRDQLSNPASRVLVSAVSTWEIAIKVSLGKMPAPPGDILVALDRLGFERLPIEHEDTLLVESLPLHHKDPFDRLLVAQARRRACTLVTKDEHIPAYGIPVLKP